MKQRGTILRDTRTGPGLVIVDGRQHPFTLEGIWRSGEAPAVNMTVDAQFNEVGTLIALFAVPEAQLAREKADEAMVAVKARGSQLVARMGMGTLVGTGLLATAWFALNTVSVQLTPGMKIGMSLWKLLGVLNTSGDAMAALSGNGGSTGMYGVLAIAALAGPAASYFVRDARAQLANCLPLLFLLGIGMAFYAGISSSLSQTQSAAMAFGGNAAADMVGAMTREAMRAFSIGVGGYLGCAVSLYFAATGVLKFLAKRG
ncbi:hypothetical protein [Ralstonia flaminis]|jgi:hypothetical protein|uniref:Uncharacterized protein n=1 Tax=Ralstonia flaminis TaxID=3058597 RepID=A0ABM9K5L2_9RALS|nr:hypothetical protein [Ralstonia sp. LMG 18101]CAJ0816179.1 hypothetical protein LMG18101_02836 [Ralstonia sp. LMG 18101]